ncbi:PilN domain-containing protein [Evansella tamaricis]|uniref:Uncharacterized protein n=1 Tax=Evansella tamaricis TaxID=2069301 RepID=A0ABS6JBZ8_9BACI|nr:hypothetical protein [Evansella tamaricis]MBU9711018.1 hypothetical protein [Evansella tamaricis]
MKISINLLPKKPKKNYMTVLIFGVGYAASMILLIAGIIIYQSIQREYDFLESQIDTTIQLQAIASENQTAAPNITQLDTYVDQLDGQRVSSIHLLDQFISQLPQRSSFVRYEYNEGGTVEITASFEENRGVSSYLYHLNKLPFVVDAMINSVNTESQGNDEEQQGHQFIATFSITMDMDMVKDIQGEVTAKAIDGKGEKIG